MNNSWVTYTNGNYTVLFDLENGTKIRINNLDNLTPAFPENIDIKITNSCNMMCQQCHENSIPDGTHGNILNAKFFNTLHPYTELAIGGGNPLAHPDLEEFLIKCRDKHLIPNLTVHQVHFMENLKQLRHFRDEKLIYGLGVSVTTVTPELIEALHEFPNAIVHIIAGIATEDVITKLAHNNLKILILGYKLLRRGKEFYEKNNTTVDFLIQYMYDILPEMISNEWFNTVSFDNLAIKQLNPKRFLTEEQYNEFYMGNDGDFTFYIDLVNEVFSISSTATERFPLMNTVEEMFEYVRKNNSH